MENRYNISDLFVELKYSAETGKFEHQAKDKELPESYLRFWHTKLIFKPYWWMNAH